MTYAPFIISVYEKAAFMISYSDEVGMLLFSIEPISNQQIYLNSRASVDGRIADDEMRSSERYKSAVERVRCYLARHGAKVEIDE
jgi:hypothetical protein